MEGYYHTELSTSTLATTLFVLEVVCSVMVEQFSVDVQED